MKENKSENNPALKQSPLQSGDDNSGNLYFPPLAHEMEAKLISRELTSAEFTEEALRALRTEFPSENIQIVEDCHVQMMDFKGPTAGIRLDRPYSMYLAEPEKRAAIIRQHVLALRDGIDGLRELKDPSAIVPVILAKAALTANANIPKASPFFYEEYNAELVVAYALDAPESFRYLLPEEVSDLGFPPEEFRVLARNNLSRILPRPTITLANGLGLAGNQDCYQIESDLDYNSGLLLFDEFWSVVATKVRGEIVVGVPMRQLLYATGSEDVERRKAMRTSTEEQFSRAAYAVSPKLFVYRQGKFEVFED